MRTKRVLVLGVVLSVLSVGGTALGAGARAQRAFTLIARGNIASLTASGGWAFYVRDIYSPPKGGTVTVIATVGTLIDERTGKRTILHVPGCSRLGQALLGGPWLMVTCAGDLSGPNLYDLSRHRWTHVTLDRTVGPPGGLCETGGCSFVGLGRDWIEIEYSSYHQPNEYFIARIPTGAFAGNAVVANGRLAFDLSSPSGTRQLCAPLRYPSVPRATPDGPQQQPGWIEPLGRFALIADNYPTAGDYTQAQLARCASQRRITLPSNGIAATRHAIVWPTQGRLSGLLLPSLKRFNIPTALSSFGPAGWPTVALTTTHIYLSSGKALWATSLP